MKNLWQLRTTIIENERYEINGLNILENAWIGTGERIDIIDSIKGNYNSLEVYLIEKNNVKAYFAAVEFSSGVWGIYEKITSKTLN